MEGYFQTIPDILRLKKNYKQNVAVFSKEERQYFWYAIVIQIHNAVRLRLCHLTNE